MTVESKDMLMTIYKTLSNNEFINKSCGNRIKFYEFPETGDMSQPFIIIDPLDAPNPNFYGSNTELSQYFTYQIDVQSSDRIIVKQLQSQIKKELETINFRQLAGGLDEYFKETGRYVDARRYRGASEIYDTNY